MKMRVKYDELKGIGTYIEDRTNTIEEALNNINSIVLDVESAWSGVDSEEFVKKMGETIDKELDRLDNTIIVSEAIKYAAINYKNKDDDWLEQLKRGEINQ